MPIYEYDCPKCGVVEVTQRITDAPLQKCPTCKRKVKKLISASAFQFKGEGWYVTDYARKGKGDNGKGDKGNGKSESAAETKSESKSDSTSASATKPEPSKPATGGSPAKSAS